MNGRVDLHVHTTASDGGVAPTGVVELAERKGLRAVAVTDHDTTGGIAEAVSAGRGRRVEVVPGVELSVHGGELGALHIVGLWVDSRNPDLESRLGDMVRGREERGRRMVARLAELGCPLDLDEVRRLAGGEVIGRPHFARALVHRGYVGSMREAFSCFLGRGKPAYMDRERMHAREAIGLIRRAGGVAALAHPGLIKASPKELEEGISVLRGQGLGGVEVYYPGHAPSDVERLSEVCRRFGLAPSGGTDFHGDVKPEIELGGIAVPAEVLDPLRSMAGRPPRRVFMNNPG